MRTITRILHAITAGLVMLAISLYIQQQAGPQLPPPDVVATTSYNPTRIIIPNINLDLPIKPATVNANDWIIYENAASWLSSSGNMESGNIVIYSHNIDSLFGPITTLQSGDQIILEGKSGKQIYHVTESFQGKSSDIHHITNTNNRLTLYTCAGLLDTKRHFIFATNLNN